MMRPMMRKVAFGVPAVALSAALACTMAGCGGTEGGQGESGDNAPAGQTANSVQSAEVAGFTMARTIAAPPSGRTVSGCA